LAGIQFRFGRQSAAIRLMLQRQNRLH
jgi:hypothetical protein